MSREKIRVRTYNVGFGDCFLVSIPEKTRKRHMLVDFGNAIGKGGSNAPFRAVAEDIQRETGGHLDVAVVTHEHADHMEGFYHQRKIFNKMTIDNVWMSMPSHRDYYKEYKNAEVHKRMKALADSFAREASRRGLALAPSFERLLRNNLSNATRIAYIRDEAAATTWFVSRGADMRGTGLGSVKVRILAPEDDVSVYYGKDGKHLAPDVRAVASGLAGSRSDPYTFPHAKRAARKTPSNLTGSEWRRLHESIQMGGVQVMRSIDRAQNNTSLVFTIEAGGKKLLFTGDAEVESWKIMAAKNLLGPVDFLKVSHHGSHNGTPLVRLDKLLPKKGRKKGRAAVVISTQSKVYGTKNPVPDKKLLTELGRRTKNVHSTDGLDEPWIDVAI